MFLVAGLGDLPLGTKLMRYASLEEALRNEADVSSDPALEYCWHMEVSVLRRQAGDLDAAIDDLIRALHAARRAKVSESRCLYEIGDAYEAHGHHDLALEYFLGVAREDAEYQDVRGSVRLRIARLTPAG